MGRKQLIRITADERRKLQKGKAAKALKADPRAVEVVMEAGALLAEAWNITAERLGDGFPVYSTDRADALAAVCSEAQREAAEHIGIYTKDYTAIHERNRTAAADMIKQNPAALSELQGIARQLSAFVRGIAPEVAAKLAEGRAEEEGTTEGGTVCSPAELRDILNAALQSVFASAIMELAPSVRICQ